jgi:anaerobic ribonucleoside-triphosphate reductase activating protein
MSDRIISDLNNPHIKRRGLSLSGGDPLHPANLSAVLALITRVRQECPGKDIWCWTGYTLAELTADQQAVVDLLDTLIDGKFIKELADPALVWHGSSNQNIHHFDRSRAWWHPTTPSLTSCGDIPC